MTIQTISLEATPDKVPRYDRLTITLHWLTALLVVSLFALAQVWDVLQKGTTLRLGFQSLHISLGMTLAAVIAIRIIWRLAHRGDLPPATSGFQHILAKAAHSLLYLLLVLQVTLGFLFRWSQNQPLSFFGIFALPQPDGFPVYMRGTFALMHYWVAWSIIILAGLHACAALFHHYVLKDRVLVRMFPVLADKSCCIEPAKAETRTRRTSDDETA